MIMIAKNLRQMFKLVDRIVVFRQGRIMMLDQGVHADASYI
ncbi:hypothetical protein [Parasulfitobacter algicola]|nr:hypothetical protein [Sulfitobacter algicola]